MPRWERNYSELVRRYRVATGGGEQFAFAADNVQPVVVIDDATSLIPRPTRQTYGLHIEEAGTAGQHILALITARRKYVRLDSWMMTGDEGRFARVTSAELPLTLVVETDLTANAKLIEGTELITPDAFVRSARILVANVPSALDVFAPVSENSPTTASARSSYLRSWILAPGETFAWMAQAAGATWDLFYFTWSEYEAGGEGTTEPRIVTT